MPLVDANDPNVWATQWTGGYTRSNTDVYNDVRRWAAYLIRILNLQPGQSIALIGVAFGWELEEFFAEGFAVGKVVGCDSSTYIQGNKGNQATSTILNEDGSTSTSQRNIKQALGVTGNNKANWAISMDISTWLTDSECTKAATSMRAIATNCAHFVTCGNYAIPPAVGNWKTLTQWKTLLTPDTVVARGAFDNIGPWIL